MLEYYGSREQDPLYNWMIDIVTLTENAMGGSSGYHAVLFGGLLGSIYSLLQFMFAPLVGRLSDIHGRRPVLLICLMGITVSYLLWFFAGSFTLLVVSRLIGGVMSANISTATAVVADVTTRANRSKGMALIGVAFGLGFVSGPAIGAGASLIDLSLYWPQLTAFGLNPFSAPALVALILSIINIAVVFINFSETLPEAQRGNHKSLRSINPMVLFKVEQFKGVNLNNSVYFLYILAFTGMEFTLTFLTFERLKFDNMDQAMMFIFIGFILIMMQGGYVRRKAPLIGERKMAFRGLCILIPGLAILGFAHNNAMLYLGLFLMSVGSSQVIPCLTTLTSQYAPKEEQGRVVGVFRSLGSLGRAIGPIISCLVYWKLGATTFYMLGATFILLPLIIVRRLPKPSGSLA